MGLRVSVKHTLSTNLVDGSQQFADALMRVDTLGYTFEAVSEDELDDGAVDIGRVKHTGKRVAALMRGVHHAEVLHDGVEDGAAERVITVARTVLAGADVFAFSLHGVLVPRYEALGDGDEPPASRLGLAVPDDDDAPPQLDVGLADVPVLADTASGVDEHEHMTRFWHIINATPQAVALTDGKRLFLVQFTRSVNIEISGIIFDDQVISYCVLVKLLEQRADFLLRRVSAPAAADIVNDLVKMAEPYIDKNHLMEAEAMPIRISVADACGFASETREVLSFPQCVDLSKSGLARAQQGRVVIVLDQVRHRVFKCFEVPQGFLSMLDGLLDDIRPPPVPA